MIHMILAYYSTIFTPKGEVVLFVLSCCSTYGFLSQVLAPDTVVHGIALPFHVIRP